MGMSICRGVHDRFDSRFRSGFVDVGDHENRSASRFDSDVVAARYSPPFVRSYGCKSDGHGTTWGWLGHTVTGSP